jgi:Thaumatin family
MTQTQPGGRYPRRTAMALAAGLVVTVLVVVGVAALGHRGTPAASPTPVAGSGSSTAGSAAPSSPDASPSVAMSSSAPSASPSSAPASTKPPTATNGPRMVTFVNAVRQTVWVAGAQQTAQPALPVSGWVLAAGQSITITVPDHWNGRFWGRTGCAFNGSGQGHCQTGDCSGHFQCTGYGGIPASLAEFNLNAWQNMDFYDVSLVDGSNLPMYINITHGTTKDPISAAGCSSAGCTKAVACPAELQVHAGDPVVGCISPCAKFNSDQYCCRGQWASRAACDPTKWPVNYAAIFKAAEPFAYSYSNDDATSTFTCTGECGYRITFGLSP